MTELTEKGTTMDEFNIINPEGGGNASAPDAPATEQTKPKSKSTRKKQSAKKAQPITLPSFDDLDLLVRGLCDRSSTDLDGVVNRVSDNGLAIVRDDDNEIVMFALSKDRYDQLIGLAKKACA